MDLTEAQRVQRGDRARQAIEEFFEPTLRHVASVFQARLQEVCAKEPWSADKIAALANVIRITEEIGGDIRAYIYEGEHARKSLIRVEKYEKLTPAKRRLLNIGSLG